MPKVAYCIGKQPNSNPLGVCLPTDGQTQCMRSQCAQSCVLHVRRAFPRGLPQAAGVRAGALPKAWIALTLL